MDVREGFEERLAPSSAACGPLDPSRDTAPHRAVSAGVAGPSEACQTPEAVAAAWVGAQAEAEAAGRRGPGKRHVVLLSDDVVLLAKDGFDPST